MTVFKTPQRVTWVRSAAIAYACDTPGRPGKIGAPHEYDEILHVFVTWDDGTTSEWSPDTSPLTGKRLPAWALNAIDWATNPPSEMDRRISRLREHAEMTIHYEERGARQEGTEPDETWVEWQRGRDILALIDAYEEARES